MRKEKNSSAFWGCPSGIKGNFYRTQMNADFQDSILKEFFFEILSAMICENLRPN
jgi:hypothetical protein